MQYDI